jgi:hypothetical protein
LRFLALRRPRLSQIEIGGAEQRAGFGRSFGLAALPISVWEFAFGNSILTGKAALTLVRPFPAREAELNAVDVYFGNFFGNSVLGIRF